MCEFLIIADSGLISGVNIDDFEWGAMESFEQFQDSKRQLTTWHGNSYLLKCPNTSVVSGGVLVNKKFDSSVLDQETINEIEQAYCAELQEWELYSGVIDGD